MKPTVGGGRGGETEEEVVDVSGTTIGSKNTKYEHNTDTRTHKEYHILQITTIITINIWHQRNMKAMAPF